MPQVMSWLSDPDVGEQQWCLAMARDYLLSKISSVSLLLDDPELLYQENGEWSIPVHPFHATCDL